MAGYYTKTFSLGDFTLVNPSDYYSRIYLAKLGPDGQVLWLQDVESGRAYDDGIGVTLDDSGNCYITGTMQGAIFAAKYNPAGERVWVNNFNAEYYGYGKGLALDQADNVYIIAQAQNYLGDVFLAKLDNGGNTVWVKLYESTCHTNGASGDNIAVDALGNSYITGTFACDTLDFDGIAVQNSGGWSDKAFLARIGPEGKTLWAKQLPNLGRPAPVIALTETNGLILAGAAGGPVPQLFKYDTAGNELWISAGNTYHGVPKAIATDYEGNIYLGGTSFGNYGGTEMDFHVEKYTPDGAFSWKREVKTSSGDYLYDMRIDAGSNAYVVGRSGLQGIGVKEPGYLNQAHTVFVARLQTGSTTHLRPYKPVLDSFYAVCKGEPAPTLKAVGDNIAWYSSPTAGSNIHTGSSFSPTVTATDTFYVSQTVEKRESWRKPVVVFVSGLDDFTVRFQGDTLFAPASEGYTYQWFRAGTLLSAATSSYLVADTTAVYKVVVSDGYCVRESRVNTATLAAGEYVQSALFKLRAFPNPSPGTVRVQVTLPAPADLQLSIYNTSGLRVYSLSTRGREELTSDLDLHHLPGGLYILEAVSKSGRRTVRFLKN